MENVENVSSEIFHIYHSENNILLLRRRNAVNTEQLQRKLSPLQRLRLAILYYFRLDSIARFLFVSTCFIWFLINFVTVFKDFINFDTIVYMEYRSPKQTRPPGITFCTHCIYCGLTNHNEMLVHPVIHNLDTGDDDVENDPFKYSQRKKIDNIKKNNFSQINLSDFILYCRLYPTALGKSYFSKSNYIDCSNLAPVVVSMQEGHKCFTYFSDIFGDISRKHPEKNLSMMMEFDRFPYIEIGIRGKYFQTNNNWNITNSNYVFDDRNSEIKKIIQIFLALHSPTIFPDMLSLSYHRLFPSKYTQIQFLKMTEKRKPWPYRTKCFHYNNYVAQTPEEIQENSDEWVFESQGKITANELKLFRSRGECFIYCMWRYLGHNHLCLNFYTIFTEHLYFLEKQIRIFEKLKKKIHEISGNLEDRLKILKNLTDRYDKNFKMRFCTINESFQIYEEVKRDCLKNCPSGCYTDTFWIDTSYNLDINSETNNSLIRIEWSTQPVVYIEHREKFSTAGFLGNIGGHAHIWLGVSVISICNFLIEIIKSRSLRIGWPCFWFVYWIRGFTINHR